MKDKVKEMLKNVIEENAIQFKASTSDALYNKIGNRLKDEYKTVAKKMFNSLQEAAPVSGTSIAAGQGATEQISAETAAVAPPNTNPRRDPTEPIIAPDTTVQEWMQQMPDPNKYDQDRDGRLSPEELNAWERDLAEWYERYLQIQEAWEKFRGKNSPKYKPAKPASWEKMKGIGRAKFKRGNKPPLAPPAGTSDTGPMGPPKHLRDYVI